MPKHTMRKLHVNDEIFEYRIGSDCIVVRNEHNIKTIVSFEELTGLSREEIERGCNKRYIRITPSMIKDYIVKNRLLFLLGK